MRDFFGNVTQRAVQEFATRSLRDKVSPISDYKKVQPAEVYLVFNNHFGRFELFNGTIEREEKDKIRNAFSGELVETVPKIYRVPKSFELLKFDNAGEVVERKSGDAHPALLLPGRLDHNLVYAV